MSTKTIALDMKVYQKLIRLKGESESFSKTIDRLLNEAAKAHTGASILANLKQFKPLSASDARKMKKIVQENRKNEKWELHDLS